MYNSIILPLAKEDIQEAAKWYNERQIGLGKRFTAEVRENVHFIRQNPKTSTVSYNCLRTAVLKGFPFMIHFIINEKNKTIIITAILHTSRNPKFWENR